MNPLLVVMGVSGCGKSTVGALLAGQLGLEFVEGDQWHPQRNIARMSAGIALTDEDRLGWLQLLANRLAQAHQAQRGLVVSCSALKRSYRDTLRSGAPGLLFVHLAGTPALLAIRTAERVQHYMPTSLLASQFAILEPPGPDEHALTQDVALGPAAIVDAVLLALAPPAPLR